jgi:hypothetical protein
VYGPVGLLVVCLVGYHEDLKNMECRKTDSATAHRQEMFILACSKQCVPVLQFEASQIDKLDTSRAGNVRLDLYHAEMQHILNDMFLELPVAPKVCDTAPVAATVEPNRLEL